VNSCARFSQKLGRPKETCKASHITNTMQQKLINITDVVSSEMSKAEEETMALLPAEFVPGKWDVICQRGKECYDHGKFSLVNFTCVLVQSKHK
jgi:hypothetical protein